MWVKVCDTVPEAVEKGGFCTRRVFSVGHMHLSWKRMPKTTYVIGQETCPFKVLPSIPDSLTILLCANAMGDLRLPPLLIDSTLPSPEVVAAAPSLLWETHPQSLVTPEIFSTWMEKHFAPTVLKYCRDNNLEEKVLLVVSQKFLDPSLPPCPAGVTINPLISKSPPFCQGVTGALRSQYLLNLFLDVHHDFPAFWSNYDLAQAVVIIAKSWNNVKQRTFQVAWKKLWPDSVPELPPPPPRPVKPKAAPKEKQPKKKTQRVYFTQPPPPSSSSSSSSTIPSVPLTPPPPSTDAITCLDDITDHPTQVPPISHKPTHPTPTQHKPTHPTPTQHKPTHPTPTQHKPTPPTPTTTHHIPGTSQDSNPLTSLPLAPLSPFQVHRKVERLLRKVTLLAHEKDPDLGRSTRFCLHVTKAFKTWSEKFP